MRSDEPKLIDFGLARHLSAEETRHTRDGQVLGTIAYMAPEQLRGEDVGLAADVYSMALVACEVLARRPLLSAVGGAGAAVPHFDRFSVGVPDVRKWCPEVEPSVAMLLGRALSTDAAERPVSAPVLLDQWPAENRPGAGSSEVTGALTTAPTRVTRQLEPGPREPRGEPM